MAVLDIPQLEILKLRNNPLTSLPSDIHRLKKLRTLVVSFCLLQSLPMRYVMKYNQIQTSEGSECSHSV